MEAFCRIRVNGEARQVLDAILRKTYGWNKKEDSISLSQFFLMTGLKKPSIIRAIHKLLNMNIISENANGNIKKYRFNKDFDTWKRFTKPIIVSNIANSVSENANKSLAKPLPTKERDTKETLTKEPPAISENRGEVVKVPLQDSLTPSEYYRDHYAPRGSRRKTDAPSPQIVAVLDLFKPVNPAYLSLRLMDAQRAAADRLLKITNYEGLRDLVAFIVKNRAEQYMPTITTPVALEKKMGDLTVYYQKQKNKAPAFI